MTGSTCRRVLIGGLLLLVVACVRGGFLAARADLLSDDPDAYRTIAQTLAQTGVLGVPTDPAAAIDRGSILTARPTAFRPPLYPWLLSWLVGDDGQLRNLPVAILQWLMGVLTVVLTWDIARRLYLMPLKSRNASARRAALIAAGFVLVDPILLWQSTLVMTETIATLLVVMTWWWWVARIAAAKRYGGWNMLDSVVLGCLLLLAILCRPTFLVWAAMLFVVLGMLAVFRSRLSASVPSIARMPRMAGVIAGVAIVTAGVGTWAWRNVTAVGHPVWGTTHGGYTLLLANNDSFYDYLQTKPWQWPWRNTAWEPTDFFESYQALPWSGDEYQDDRIAYDAARRTIRHRPAMFWYSSFARFIRLWQPFPHATAERSTGAIVMVGVFHSLMYVLVVVALIRHRGALVVRRWREWIPSWPAAALIVTLSLVHAVYWSNPRMRSPAIPVLAIAAAAAFLSRSDSDTNESTVDPL